MHPPQRHHRALVERFVLHAERREVRPLRVGERRDRADARLPATIERSANVRAFDEATAEEYVAHGVTYLLVNASGPDYDLGELEKLVRWRDRRQG